MLRRGLRPCRRCRAGATARSRSSSWRCRPIQLFRYFTIQSNLIVLAPQIHLTGAAMVANTGFHYISPWAALAAWLVYIFGQGGITHWYPYPFLDVTVLGFGAALRNAVLVVVLAVVFAAGFKVLDRRLPALLR